MKAQFIRGENPKKTMQIGTAYLDDAIKKLQLKSSKKQYLKDKDFKDDRLIVYLFKNVYDKWAEKAGSFKLEDIEIWDDTTSGNTPIIKIKAPGIRETTLLRGESNYELIEDDIVNFLNSPEIKKKISDALNKESKDVEKLTDMIFYFAKRKGLLFGMWGDAEIIADRLIELNK